MKLMMEDWEEGETSECSSGCQSGWTMYLDQSYDNQNPTSIPYRKIVSDQQEVDVEIEEEEEDLSMVSDASSGPPHFHEEEDEQCFAAISENGGKRRRFEAAGHKPTKQETFSLLDDTASSPLFSFSKTSKKNSVDDVLEFSCDFSATHFKKKSELQKHHLGYLQSPSTVKPTSARPRYAEMKARRRHGDGSQPPLF